MSTRKFIFLLFSDADTRSSLIKFVKEFLFCIKRDLRKTKKEYMIEYTFNLLQ